MQEYKLYLEIGALLVTLFGVPSAIYVYWQQKSKERKEREYGTYNALDDKYIDFLNLCLENHDLDIYHIAKKGKSEYSPEQNARELIIFEILISLFERAFLMYRDQDSKIKKLQWEGWNRYMEDWMQRDNFRRAWERLGTQWELNFENHMKEVYRKVQAKHMQSDSKT
ncbi:hypothetical protein WJR50_19215 [Catalinimonas sp. 4WD22]|uniref:hypothetical protein n=1 Tax=Catalinimonas locisalis TaxID=3133978 RepID=UPI003101376A